MRKIYQKPEIEMVLIAQPLLQSTSPDVTIDPDDPGIPPGEFEVKEKRDGQLHYNVWDDKWDE